MLLLTIASLKIYINVSDAFFIKESLHEMYKDPGLPPHSLARAMFFSLSYNVSFPLTCSSLATHEPASTRGGRR